MAGAGRENNTIQQSAPISMMETPIVFSTSTRNKSVFLQPKQETQAKDFCAPEDELFPDL
jgi:hypothetical protein